ncbi:hypothetical protein AB0392_12700 [Nonomuraea angiospora]|uniref:hypothetical protein n=1 Tax=Nonomuraea angiospora TaxID=46172 RepID=UPI00344B0628
MPGSGGPAGNARLTAWTGLALLVLFLVELTTLFDLEGLISWHIVVGVLLVPPALLKTATTGWRIARYYTDRPAYRRAGPPPMPLRVLGPLVVLLTLAALGTGLALIPLGPEASWAPLATLAGQNISALTLHKTTAIAWTLTTSLHTIGRLVPALRITGLGNKATRVPGRMSRAGVLLLTLVIATATAILLLSASGSWVTPTHHP